MNRLMQYLRDMKIRQRLFVYCMGIIVLPTGLLVMFFYQATARIVLNNTTASMQAKLAEQTNLINIDLSRIQDISLQMLSSEVSMVFAENPSPDSSQLLTMNRRLTALLDSYFGSLHTPVSVNLLTSYYPFGRSNLIFFDEKNVLESRLYRTALQAGGRTVWIPTYDDDEMFSLGGLTGKLNDYPQYCSAVKQLNLMSFTSYSTQGDTLSPQALAANIERPVLMVRIDEKSFRTRLASAFPRESERYYILAPDQTVVTATDQALIGGQTRPAWLSHIDRSKSGSFIIDIDNVKNLVCFDTIDVCGWMVATEIPVRAALSDLDSVRLGMLLGFALLVAVCAWLSLLVSRRVAGPIKDLADGMARMEQGDFEVSIQEEHGDELGFLVRHFNRLNERINRLIVENYRQQIMERDNELAMLTLQLNPHFLRNTLSVANYMAIARGQNDLSEVLVGLSDMLQYTLKRNGPLVPLCEDLEALRSYVAIMRLRFIGVFEVVYNIDPSLKELRVPKFFLQPLIENAILHGFANTDQGGTIYITGEVRHGVVTFHVRDNGRGMSPTAIQQIMEGTGERIGLKNVDNRIRLLYGAGYGLTVQSFPDRGTDVAITLPLTTETSGEQGSSALREPLHM